MTLFLYPNVFFIFRYIVCPKSNEVQRQAPVMVNIMRDIPRVDTQEAAHCRLLLSMSLPFFDLDDLKSSDESWTHATRRVDETDA